jgi:hypothetical protein
MLKMRAPAIPLAVSALGVVKHFNQSATFTLLNQKLPTFYHCRIIASLFLSFLLKGEL